MHKKYTCSHACHVQTIYQLDWLFVPIDFCDSVQIYTLCPQAFFLPLSAIYKLFVVMLEKFYEIDLSKRWAEFGTKMAQNMAIRVWNKIRDGQTIGYGLKQFFFPQNGK